MIDNPKNKNLSPTSIRQQVKQEIKLLTNDYQFKHRLYQQQLLKDIEFVVLDHRQKGNYKRSYQNRTDFKMAELTAICDYYVNLDQQKVTWISKEPDIKAKQTNKSAHQTKNRESLWTNKYLIIDFETANKHSTSACQVGIIVVENNEIVWQYETLIQPKPNYFAPMNIRIHGINNATVAQAPSFIEVWAKLEPYFNGQYIILAHNAAFDIDWVLRPTLNSHKISEPNFLYACTWQMYRHLRTYASFSLHNLAQQKNIRFKHHNALEDSLVLLKIINEDFGNIEHFFKEAMANHYEPLVFQKSLNGQLPDETKKEKVKKVKPK
ncbi:exonuclease [Entomoplasma freundtii]|uniref:DNA polymerase III subunit epsilon n=1 Tax=Entomoplasma freundtii TaxID=74700 RepID=A0A2K8NTV8_9MOLU|nr:exonuclease domain-containing protein [Entomoplasma freundtii]ATZ16191.1 DNA polymerase III subunit epsilon [Entomoplasma freundtii]TDY56908.1 exonuclease [Entomoplasma freundtii]